MLLVVLYTVSLLIFNLCHQHDSNETNVIIMNENRMETIKAQYTLNDEFVGYKKRDYTKWTERSKYYRYLQDEKEMMFPLFNNTEIKPHKCKTKDDFLIFFNRYKSVLLKKCTDYRRFSHCQQHYLFQYDTDEQTCHSYHHESYISMNYTGVTMTLPLSTKRLDRFPLHLERWKGPMSIAIQITEDELPAVARILSSIQRRNIRWTLYIVKKQQHSDHCTFVSMNGTKVKYEVCFVVNELRNLAIETIRTTHFLIVDGDGIISTTFESNLKQFIPRLSDPLQALLIPLFPYNNPNHKECITTGDCKEAWSHLPKTKQELLQHQDYIEGIRSTYLFFNVSQWKSIKTNTLIQMKAPRTMEPYGVFKRTNTLPLFHPYFVNYGGNKEQYFNVLNTMNYKYNVMTMDFTVDLPHPPSSFIKVVRTGPKKVFAQQLFAYFNKMFNEYCMNHECQYFSRQYVDTAVLKGFG